MRNMTPDTLKSNAAKRCSALEAQAGAMALRWIDDPALTEDSRGKVCCFLSLAIMARILAKNRCPHYVLVAANAFYSAVERFVAAWAVAEEMIGESSNDDITHFD